MITDEDKKYDWITEQVIGCAYHVHNTLGSGFMEKCYENALAHECRKAGLTVQQQVAIKVWCDGVVIGKYIADLIVEGLVLVELKAGKGLDEAHKAQCINYLAATGLPVALLINLSQRATLNRIVGPNLRSSSVPIGAPSVAK
jgi:GxxExxY protein